MKIERIGDNIIRVTITYSDLEERNVDLNALNYNSPAAQEFFWDLMEQAEEQLGFNLTDSQLIIEPVPDSDEGFVINITKVDEEGEFESIHKYIKNRMKKSDLRVKRKARRVSSAFDIYIQIAQRHMRACGQAGPALQRRKHALQVQGCLLSHPVEKWPSYTQHEDVRYDAGRIRYQNFKHQFYRRLFERVR